jgi:TfoX/Sxy family transcriptional regulator of competence genes
MMDPDHLRDLFSSFRPVTVRRMFGGAGIFVDGVSASSWMTSFI